MRRTEILAAGALTVAALIFGTGYVVMQHGLNDVATVPLVGIRFATAAVVLLLIGRGRAASPRLVRDGVQAGISYLIGIVCQTAALRLTDAATVAFVTFLLVVTVPMLEWLVRKKRPQGVIGLAVTIALCGLFLLSGGASGFGRGEILAVIGAVAFGWHIIQMGDAASRHDPFRFNAIQCLTVALPCCAVIPVAGGLPTAPAGWWVALYAGLVITVCTLVPWLWAQRHLPPARTALILLSEPVFAAVADAVTGHPMRASGVVGAGLILAAAVLSETVGRRRPPSPIMIV